MVPRRITRREFLKTAGTLLLAAAGGGCVPYQQTALPAQAVNATLPLPGNTPSPTLLEPPTSTPARATESAPTETATAEPTQTPAPSASGDVLTAVQKERLYRASLAYVVDTEEEAIAKARGLAYVKNDGHPASMCGPLSVAILRDAGLLNAYINLHEFWLLNPRDHLSILQKIFPGDRFWWYSTTQSITEFDFNAFPLKTGDWLYLYAGDAGSFEHMLTVSRVDSDGRVYSVTNYETSEGYFIDELLLYDPAQPGSGQFAVWTDRKYAAIGMTGFGGFQLMRFSAPVPEPTSQQIVLARKIDQILVEAGGDWKILIKKLNGFDVYARRDRDRLHAASVIKLPVAVLCLRMLEMKLAAAGQDAADLASELKNGTGGRSYEQLLYAMLVNSEERATEILLEALRQSHLNLTETLMEWGAGSIDLQNRRGTPVELVLLAEKLYLGELLAPESTKLLLDLLASYTPNDDLRLGVLRQVLPEGAQIYNKRGTLTEERLIVADLAIVTLPAGMGNDPASNGYVAAVFAYQSDGYQDVPPTTYERLDAAVSEVALAFGEYLEEIL